MTQRNIITAGPGWYVLRLTGSDRSGSYGIDREPIVGWATTAPDELMWERDGGHDLGWPVTDGSMSGLTWVPVLSPDGRVRLPGGAVLDSEDAWLKHAGDARVMSLKGWSLAQ